MQGGMFTVPLNKEAFDKLCAIRDEIQDMTGEWFPLHEVCNTLIMQVGLEAEKNETVA